MARITQELKNDPVVFLLLSLLFFILIRHTVYADGAFEDTRLSLDDENKIAYIAGGSLSLRMAKGELENKLLMINFLDKKIKYISGEWRDNVTSVRKVKLSQDKKKLAVSLQKRNKIRNRNLSIYSLESQETIWHREGFVWAYSWCGNDSIVYIDGKSASSRTGDVYMYNIETNKNKFITGNGEKVFCLGRDVYIKKYKELNGTKYYSWFVSGYNIVTGDLTSTKFNDVNLSPGKKYYCNISSEPETMAYPAIITTKNNEVVRSFYDESLPRGIVNCYWASDRFVVLHTLSSYFVYDMNNKNIINSISSLSNFPVSFSGKNVVVYKDGFWILKNLFTNKEQYRVKDVIN